MQAKVLNCAFIQSFESDHVKASLVSVPAVYSANHGHQSGYLGSQASWVSIVRPIAAEGWLIRTIWDNSVDALTGIGEPL